MGRIFLLRVLPVFVASHTIFALEARVYHGPYAGLHGTYHINALKAQHETATLPTKLKAETMSIGLHGGYARTFDNRMFMGLDAYIAYDNISKLNKDYTVEQNGVSVNTHIKINRTFSLGLDLRVGYNLEKFFPGALLYTGGTFAMSRFQMSGTMIEIGSAKGNGKTQFLYGLGPVVGGEFRIKGPLVLGVHYKFHIYGKKKFVQMTIRPKVNSFTGYLSYYF